MSWKNLELVKELFEEARARSGSRRIQEEAAREISDLDMLEAFFKNLFEAKAAVGKDFSVSGNAGRIVDVAGGYVHMDLGKAKTAFRIRDMTSEEVSKLAQMMVEGGGAETKRGFAVYLIHAGMMARALAILESLGLEASEMAYYRAKTTG